LVRFEGMRFVLAVVVEHGETTRLAAVREWLH
jgi:hypothetical protein